MKKMNKLIAYSLSAVMVASVMFSANVQTVSAKSQSKAVTAAKLLKTAAKNSAGFDTISYGYDLNRSIKGEIRNRIGMCQSDSKIDHGYFIDNSQNEKAWEEYSKQDKVYRKAYNSKTWTVYTDSTYDSKKDMTHKKTLEKYLQQASGAKITSRSSKSYTVNAKLSGEKKVKKATFVIDKKTGLVNSVKLTYKDYTSTYLNSTETYEVKNQVLAWTNIAYGNGNLKLPAGL